MTEATSVFGELFEDLAVISRPRVVLAQRPPTRIWVAIGYGEGGIDHATVGPFDAEYKAQAWCDRVHKCGGIDPDYDFEGTWRVEPVTQPTWTERHLAAEAAAAAV